MKTHQYSMMKLQFIYHKEYRGEHYEKEKDFYRKRRG